MICIAAFSWLALFVLGFRSVESVPIGVKHFASAAYNGEMGISREQALEYFASDDLIGIGMQADAVRRRLHPEGVVSYAIDGCVDLEDGLDAACAQMDEVVERGGSGVVLRSEAGLQIAELERPAGDGAGALPCRMAARAFCERDCRGGKDIRNNGGGCSGSTARCGIGIDCGR